MLINNINLCGIRIRYVGRACDLCWMGFGEDVQCVSKKGNIRIVAKYALHLQCAFRIKEQCKIIISDKDMFYPAPNFDESKDFYWDVQGDNMFDYKAGFITDFFENNNINVENVELNENYDLKLSLSNGYLIEVFNNAQADDEYGEAWRLFESGNENSHFVVYRNEIE